MKFKNVSGDALVIPALGLTVEAGDEFVVTADEAAGIAGQSDNFAPVDDEAKKAAPKKAPARKAAGRSTTEKES